MAMNTLKNPFNIPIDSIVKGKWHGNQYRIKKELGRGANGVVYLADWIGKKVAVKICENTITVTSEVNVLKALSEAQGVTLGPSLLDVDDWSVGGKRYSFYVMEYIHGEHFLRFIKRKGNIWLDILILQLLSDLQVLHKKGWVFGDLKPDNLIVTCTPVKIRCIDVGGTTLIGRAIKEFTEFFDRGYWELGSRKAEPSYDLFAVAMIMINVYYPDRFQKKRGGLQQLEPMILQKDGLKKYAPVLLRALTGKYKGAEEMRQDLLKLADVTNISPSPVQKRASVRPQKGQKRKIGAILETIFLFMIVSFIYCLYLFGQIM